MLVSKSVLQRTIKSLQRFDSAGSPYIGLQWGPESPLFHRSGVHGLIESIGYDRTKPALIVSLGHLAVSVAKTLAEEVELSTTREGVLRMVGMTQEGTDDLKIYTIRQNVTWAKAHDLGEVGTEIDPGGFAGINTNVFELASPPVLRRSKLMLVTNHGIVMRNEVPVEAYPYPREGFLRSISTLPIEKLYITRGGYWGAIAGNLRVVVAGHRFGDAVFDTYSVGATTITELPSERLLYALRQASDMAVEGGRIVIDPAVGISVRNEYGHINRYSFGTGGQGPAFSLLAKAARVIHDALSQSKDETTRLEQVDPAILRLTRGQWEVSFKMYAP